MRVATAITLALLSGACGGETPALVVDVRQVPCEAERLEVELELDGRVAEHRFESADPDGDRETSFAVRLPEGKGELSVTVRALTASDAVIAEGSASGAVPRARLDVTLTLGATATLDCGGDGGPTCEGWSYAPTRFSPCSFDLSTSWTAPSGTSVLRPDTGEMNVGEAPPSQLAVLDDVPVRIVHVDELVVPVDAELRIRTETDDPGPAILFVANRVVIAGNLNVSAYDADRSGPGVVASQCVGAESGGAAGQSGGGGGGGGYGGPGGAGLGTPAGAPTAAGGGESGDDQILVLRGGCPGAAGGLPVDMSGSAPAGGGAGGAVQISARDSIEISGKIDDGSNGGGRGQNVGLGVCNTLGQCNSGGGGGGSGGTIFLEAPLLTVAGALCANGGGGGSGADNTGDGQRGDGSECASNEAQGGTGRGGDGGAGGWGGIDTIAGADAPPLEGGEGPNVAGGGGGGGAGRIRLRFETSELSGIISPLPGQDSL